MKFYEALKEIMTNCKPSTFIKNEKFDICIRFKNNKFVNAKDGKIFTNFSTEMCLDDEWVFSSTLQRIKCLPTSFEAALNAAKNGHTIYRENWENKYLYFNKEGQLEFSDSSFIPITNTDSFNSLYLDIKENDWIII